MIIDNEPVEYILKKERDKPDAAKFLLKPINGRVQVKLTNLIKLKKEDGVKIVEYPLGEGRMITLENCIVGWSGLKNKKGEEIPFSKDFIMELKPKDLNELYDEINSISALTDDEVKN